MQCLNEENKENCGVQPGLNRKTIKNRAPLAEITHLFSEDQPAMKKRPSRKIRPTQDLSHQSTLVMLR